MKNIISVLKNIRKQSYLKLNYRYQYAFVGIGNHSINNLYPVLHYLRVPVKYIVVRRTQNAELITRYFPNIQGTTDFDVVLNDPAIQGVFICAEPSQHFHISLKALQHNKHVFVEKPPCFSSEELQILAQTAKQQGVHIMVGLQKRYAPAIMKLTKHLTDKPLFYSYRYCTGSYPEGDPLFDLFIHGIDLMNYLFGHATVHVVTKAAEHTLFVCLNHKNGCIGNIELSTDYTWQLASEYLIVNSARGIYTLKNLEYLEFESKPISVFSIPSEKIFPARRTKNILFEKNEFLPILQNQTIYTSGYFTEIQQFIHLCEGKKAQNLSTPEHLINTYSIIEYIKKEV